MPWKVEKVKGGYNVVNQTTGVKKNKQPMSKEKATRYLRALYANTKGER
jgi:hypothetical protein